MAEIWIHGKITNGGKKSYSRRDIFYRKGCKHCDAFMIRGWKSGGVENEIRDETWHPPVGTEHVTNRFPKCECHFERNLKFARFIRDDEFFEWGRKICIGCNFTKERNPLYTIRHIYIYIFIHVYSHRSLCATTLHHVTTFVYWKTPLAQYWSNE